MSVCPGDRSDVSVNPFRMMWLLLGASSPKCCCMALAVGANFLAVVWVFLNSLDSHVAMDLVRCFRRGF